MTWGAATKVPRDRTDPWQASARIGRQLAAWSAGSVAVGAVLMLAATGETARAFGLQCLVWGAIDGAIAVAGGLALRRQRRRGEIGDPARATSERRKLRRLLWFNAGLDVLYVVTGAVLIAAWRSEAGLGHGLGVVVQGGFLLVFDVAHARRLGRTDAGAP